MKLAEKKFGKRRAQENIESAHSATPTDVSPAAITPAAEEKLDNPIIADVSKNHRYIPAATKHALWQRDRGRCCQCGTQHHLHIDHVNPVALGGTIVIDNSRLLCFSCNQRQAIKVFGIGKMERFVARGD
jgi:hypothetical protein